MRYGIIIIGIIIFIVVAVLFFSGFIKRTDDVKENMVINNTLGQYASSNTSVTFLTTGSIKSDEEYHSIRITVSKNSKTIKILSGYKYTPIETASYTNNLEAYRAFLSSLEESGFTEKKRDNSSPAGKCSLGKKFFFSATGIPEMPDNSWGSTCYHVGTFNGNLNTIQQLFRKQIPDYNKITSGVAL
jgi:hypothetical protein